MIESYADHKKLYQDRISRFVQERMADISRLNEVSVIQYMSYFNIMKLFETGICHAVVRRNNQYSEAQIARIILGIENTGEHHYNFDMISMTSEYRGEWITMLLSEECKYNQTCMYSLDDFIVFHTQEVFQYFLNYLKINHQYITLRVRGNK